MTVSHDDDDVKEAHDDDDEGGRRCMTSALSDADVNYYKLVMLDVEHDEVEDDDDVNDDEVARGTYHHGDVTAHEDLEQ